MYRDKIIFGLMAAAMFFAGCSDELADGSKHPVVTEGEEILFGAANLGSYDDGFTDGENKNGRTVYGDATYDYENKKWIYKLTWMKGDEIAIWSPQASFPNSGDKQYATYKIECDGESVESNSDAYLAKVDANGLAWGDLNTPHTIYAFYPAQLIADDETFGKKDKGVVDGEIPKRQDMISWEVRTNEKGGKDWIGKPNMQYAFMRATTTVTPANLTSKYLTLQFDPLTTAVEVTVQGKDDLVETPLQMITLRGRHSNGQTRQSVTGKFSYDIDQDKVTNVAPNMANDDEINIPLWVRQNENGEPDENGQFAPINLGKNDKITVTGFLLPQILEGQGSDIDHRTLNDLQVEVVELEGGTRIKYYDGVNIQVRTKSQIVLPPYVKAQFDANNWMSRLPGSAYISQLTIPGASEGFSGQGNYSVAGNGESSYTQALGVDDLLKEGVRAFEIGTNSSLSQIQFGNETLNLSSGEKGSFQVALEKIKNYLTSNESEFVLVTAYYMKGISNWDVWTNNMDKFLKSHSEGLKIKPFSNATTLEEARGHILLIVRTNGTEDVSGLEGSGYPMIVGWNTMKDKWDRRGYDINPDNGIFGKAEDHKYTFLGIDSQNLTNQWYGESDPRPYLTKAPNWEYLGSTPRVYVQEWKRVCREPKDYSHNANLGQKNTTHWYESYESEKIPHILAFFQQAKEALKDNPEETAIYINSLNGYYIVDGGYSGAPNYGVLGEYGLTGDVINYSADINTVVYNHILSVPYKDRGPVGIVFANFLGVEGENAKTKGKNMHGDFLLKSLILNNFSFPLMGTSGN